MFKFVKEVWHWVDLNEPEISEYSMKEFFKLALVLITAILVVGITTKIDIEKQLDHLLMIIIIMYYIYRTPLYLTLGLDLLKGNRFRILNQKKIKSEIKGRARFVVLAFFYCPIIFYIQLYMFKENNTIFYLLDWFLIYISTGLYLLASYFVLFLDKSLLGALLLSFKILITKNFRIVKILMLDLIPGFYVLLISEFIKRVNRPLTFASYCAFGLRFYPYILISTGIIYREIWSIQDINISVVNENPYSEIQDDNIYIGQNSIDLDVDKFD